MTDVMREAFRGRMVSAVRFFAAVPDDSTARRELAALLAYGPGAVALFEEVLTELGGDGSISRAALTSLRAFAIHVQRTSGQHAVSPAWLDIAPDPNEADDTVLRADEGEESPAANEESAPSSDRVTSDPPDGSDAELRPGTVCADRYVVEEPIAIGGMSTVYRATDKRNGRRVALKVLRRPLLDDPDVVGAFEREADNAWALRDPGFVQVLAQGWVDRLPFLALEYLEGQSLGSAMKGEFATGAPWRVARRILRRVGKSIAHAHAHGLVHADLKPGNIFLLENGDPRVLDLGAAQVLHGEERADLDRDRDLSGGALTPTYASPEMLLGASAEPRDDIFSLAVIGYELVAGKHPFDRYTADRARHLDIQPVRPKGIPTHAWWTLRRGLALRRDRRPATMKAFVAGLSPPLPIATIAVGGLVLAMLLAGALWSRQHPVAAQEHVETGRLAIGLTTDVLGLRRLADRPEDSLGLARRIAESTGWTGPLAALADDLAARLSPAALEARQARAIDRAVGALTTLRGAGIEIQGMADATLLVTRTIVARLNDLIQRAHPLPVDAIAHALERLHEVDPDGVRVLAPHLTDLLNERRQRLETDTEREEFDRRAEALVARFPIVPPPVGGRSTRVEPPSAGATLPSDAY